MSKTNEEEIVLRCITFADLATPIGLLPEGVYTRIHHPASGKLYVRELAGCEVDGVLLLGIIESFTDTGHIKIDKPSWDNWFNAGFRLGCNQCFDQYRSGKPTEGLTVND